MAELRDGDLERIAETDYDPTDFQAELFVWPSLESLFAELTRWLSSGAWRVDAQRGQSRLLTPAS